VWRRGETSPVRLVRSPDPFSEAGLRTAYTAHARELYGFALRSLEDPGVAEDVVQETFLRAWRSARRFDPELGSPRTWLFAILRNLIIDQVRARGDRPDVVGNVRDAAIDDDIDARLRGWVVEEALERLSVDHRTVVIQAGYYRRPAAELAVELGIPVATVRSRLFYGLKALRLALDEMGFDADT